MSNYRIHCDRCGKTLERNTLSRYATRYCRDCKGIVRRESTNASHQRRAADERLTVMYKIKAQPELPALWVGMWRSLGAILELSPSGWTLVDKLGHWWTVTDGVLSQAQPIGVENAETLRQVAREVSERSRRRRLHPGID